MTTLPKLESHRGFDMDLSLGAEVDIRKGWKKNSETREKTRQARRKQSRRKTQVRMHGWDDTHEAIWSQSAM